MAAVIQTPAEPPGMPEERWTSGCVYRSRRTAKIRAYMMMIWAVSTERIQYSAHARHEQEQQAEERRADALREQDPHRRSGPVRAGHDHDASPASATLARPVAGL